MASDNTVQEEEVKTAFRIHTKSITTAPPIIQMRLVSDATSRNPENETGKS